MNSMARRHVLVVDDDLELAAELSELLETYNLQTSIASSVAEARELEQRLRPDIALVDVWLGRERSLSLVRDWIAQAPAGPGVILLSGESLTQQDLAQLGDNPPPILRKPVDVGRIVELVERLGSSSQS